MEKLTDWLKNFKSPLSLHIGVISQNDVYIQIFEYSYMSDGYVMKWWYHDDLKDRKYIDKKVIT